MADQIEWVSLSVFIFFFALVTVMGFFAARWKAGPVSEHLDEWGLGGRQFGTWITWFLVGGDFYTAYTVIAVPALVKLAVVSLITGAVLSAMNLSAATILAQVGLTPEKLLALFERGMQWAIPNIILGSMVILPVWTVVYLLRPPRD